MNWQRYTDKQGNEVHAKQWYGRNLRAILKDLYITFTENDLLKFEKRGHFWIKQGKIAKTKVIRGDWIVKEPEMWLKNQSLSSDSSQKIIGVGPPAPISDKNTSKILSFNTKLFNEIFEKF